MTGPITCVKAAGPTGVVVPNATPPAGASTGGEQVVPSQQIVEQGADIYLAFVYNHSPGATHTARLARDAGIPPPHFPQRLTPARRLSS